MSPFFTTRGGSLATGPHDVRLGDGPVGFPRREPIPGNKDGPLAYSIAGYIFTKKKDKNSFIFAYGPDNNTDPLDRTWYPSDGDKLSITGPTSSQAAPGYAPIVTGVHGKFSVQLLDRSTKDPSTFTKWASAVRKAWNEGQLLFQEEYMTIAGREFIDSVINMTPNLTERERQWRWMGEEEFLAFWDRLTNPHQDGTIVLGGLTVLKDNLSRIDYVGLIDFRKPFLVGMFFQQAKDALQYGYDALNAAEKRALGNHFLTLLTHCQRKIPTDRVTAGQEIAYLEEVVGPYVLDPSKQIDVQYIIHELETLYTKPQEGYSAQALMLHRILERNQAMIDSAIARGALSAAPVDPTGGTKQGGGSKPRDKKRDRFKKETLNALDTTGAKQGGGKTAKEKSTKDGKNAKRQRTESTAKDLGPQCRACGRRHDLTGTCILLQHNHPDVNKSSAAWKDSEQGKRYAAAKKPNGISYKETLDPADLQAWKPKIEAVGAELRRLGEQKAGTGRYHIDNCTLSDIDDAIQYINALSRDSSDTVPVQIYHKSDNTLSHHRALIDTGALHGNYVSKNVAARIKSSGGIASSCSTTVKTALQGAGSQVARESFVVEVILPNELNNDFDTIELPVTALDIQYDMIVGRKTISRYRLLETLRKHLTGVGGDTTGGSGARAGRVAVLDPIKPVGRLANLTVVEPASKYLDPVEIAEGIEFREDDAPWQRAIWNEVPDEEIPRHIEGPTEDHIRRQQTCCTKHKAVFSTKVRPMPADLGEGMRLDVDEEMWASMRANQAPPRMMSKQRQDEVLRQVTEMLKLCVIEESVAERYSQVLLTPKPNNKWRFCVDYVLLNQCTRTKEGWPIPHIRQMMTRIGDQRPAFFAVMDLTSGYHQASIHTASRWLTAFITLFGLFQWLRIPMGLKGAPSYFQRVLALVIGSTLLHIVCELYIDDLLVFGKTFDEYLENLDKVLTKLETHGLTVNPTKCRLGMTSVEYVGYVINKDGVEMAHDRREAVFAIPKPDL